VAGVAVELAATHSVEHNLGLASEPYQQGMAGRLLRLARLCNAAGALGALAGRRSRVLSALSGAALIARSLAGRVGVFEAGVASTKDPKYVVEPQRQRISERQRLLERQRTTSVTPARGATSSPMTG